MAKEEKVKQDKKPAEKKAAPQAPQQQAKPKQQPKKEAAAAAPAKPAAPEVPPPPARLAVHYRDKVVPDLMQKHGYKTIMQVPRIKKITINMGVGETTSDKKVLDAALADMTKIAGQKPVVTKSRKSIANFKIRANFPVGCMVTLRGARMYEFLDRLVNIAIPRIRDFRGVSPNAFDGRGNYTLGLREQIAFPEVDYDRIDKVRGLEMSFVTTARTDEEGRRLLQLLGMPFAASDRKRGLDLAHFEGWAETLLHASFEDRDVLDAFIERVRRLGGEVDRDRARTVGGLTFVPLHVDAAAAPNEPIVPVA